MAWVGSICDEETARKACGSAILGDTQLGMVDGDLSSVAVAQAAALVGIAAMQICDQCIGQDVPRGFQIASNLGGTFSSSFATLEASLPSSTGHVRQMIHS